MMYKNINEAFNAHRTDVNHDSHIFLYAKMHYIRKDVWKELKLIVALRCLLDPNHVSERDVLEVVGSVAIPILQRSENTLRDFLLRICPSCFYPYSLYSDGRNERVEDRILAGYLTIIMTEQVRDGDDVLIPLDKPDPLLLDTKRACSKGGDHEWKTGGTHCHSYCSKCFQPSYL